MIEEQFFTTLKEENVLAQGCTEPIALAYAAAVARFYLGNFPEEVFVYASGNMIKNVKSVIVPNTGGLCGTEAAVLAGIVAGDHEKKLEVLDGVSSEQIEQIKDLAKKNLVKLKHEDTPVKLYIRIEMTAKNDTVIVEIKHVHTNITKIKKNDQLIFENECGDNDLNSAFSDRSYMNMDIIYDFISGVDLEKIAPYYEDILSYNTAIAKEGLINNYGASVGKMMKELIEKGLYSDDIRTNVAAFTAAGSDARMNGSTMAVMSTSGSGNQGMTCTNSVYALAMELNKSQEDLIRAVALSNLTTIYIKNNIGRLSAYCGAICASAGASAGFTYLYGGDINMIKNAVTNTLGTASGIFCDGAKASCASKIAIGVTTAFDSAMMALNGRVFLPGDGVVGDSIEETIANVSRIAKDGMDPTDKVILEVMTK